MHKKQVRLFKLGYMINHNENKTKNEIWNMDTT